MCNKARSGTQTANVQSFQAHMYKKKTFMGVITRILHPFQIQSNWPTAVCPFIINEINSILNLLIKSKLWFLTLSCELPAVISLGKLILVPVGFDPAPETLWLNIKLAWMGWTLNKTWRQGYIFSVTQRQQDVCPFHFLKFPEIFTLTICRLFFIIFTHILYSEKFFFQLEWEVDRRVHSMTQKDAAEVTV